MPPRRLTALLFALLGLLFLGLWSSILWPAMSAGTAPAGNAIFVQDLTLVLPLLFFTSWALLQAGPTGDLAPVVPWPAELNAVFVDNRGTAFIDLTAPPEPVNGSQIELLLAYGLVDSILLNCPSLQAVQILFGGHEIPTLTGHLDLSKPLVLNKEFIAS